MTTALLPPGRPPGPEDSPVPGRVCGIVVTYNSEPELLRSVVLAALDQVDEVVLVDNGSSPGSVEALKTILKDLRGRTGAPVTPIFSPRNLGLPVAFNRAIRLARSAGHRFVLLLDHDSILQVGAVEQLRRAYDRLQGVVRIGALEAMNEEPFVLPTDDFLEGYYRRKRRPIETGVTDDFLATNSGLFFTVELIDLVGGFDETYFLDAVDFEFGLRLRARGLRVLRLASARIRHRRGETSVEPGPGVRWRVRMVQPIRHYYVARDVLRTYRRYGRRFPLIGLFLLSMPIREGFLVLLFYSHRWAHLSNLALGVLHAIQGVGGPRPDRFY